MVATYSTARYRAWRPATRTLGAAFVGSAAMFVAAAVQGGSLLSVSDHTDAVPEPSTTDAGPSVFSGQKPTQEPTAPAGSAAISPSPTLATAVDSPSRQATAWTPGAAPTWNTPLGQMPVRRAPVQGLVKADPAPVTTAPRADTQPAAPATAPGSAEANQTTQPSSGSPSSSSPSTDQDRGAGDTLVGSVLGGVGHLTGGLGL